MSASQSFDYPCTQPWDDSEDDGVSPPPPPPAAPRKASRPTLDELKDSAREKVATMEELLDASRMITEAIASMDAEARADLKRIAARKPRAPKAAKTAAPAPAAAAPSQAAAASACEDAVVGKSAFKSVKRVRTTAPQAPVGAEAGGGGAAGQPVHYHKTKSLGR